LYLYFDEPLAAGLDFAGIILGFLGFIHFIWTRKVSLYISLSLMILLISPFLLTLSLGGLVNSSATIIFSTIFIPASAVIFGRSKQAQNWYLAALGLLILVGVLQAYTRQSNNLPLILVNPIMFIVNIGLCSGLLFGALSFLGRGRDRTHELLKNEQKRSERLLLNVLPEEIVPLLKSESSTTAKHYDSASVLFADIPGSMQLFADTNPEHIVDWLNEVFSMFDHLVNKYGLEKIRTIGDEYMVASGGPTARPDHAHALAHLAIEMCERLREVSPRYWRRMSFRIGINSGPLIAGVIGKTKFHYDLWGQTVNIASRMESLGVEGKIQIAPGTYDLIKEDFFCESRGVIAVKGAGQMETWFLRNENS
jgi:adenylate cyclase